MTHPELVAALCKPGEDILKAMTPKQAHLLHMAVGLCGEAGELLDAVKKHVIYQQPLNVHDEGGIVEEMGDCSFFMEGIRQCVGLHPDLPINHNIEKLTKRYGAAYSDQAAKERKDKA